MLYTEESVKATEYYRLVTTIKVDKFKAPQYYYPILTPNDISVGYVERYFVQKKSNPTAYGVTEVDKKQFFDLIDNKNNLPLSDLASDEDKQLANVLINQFNTDNKGKVK